MSQVKERPILFSAPMVRAILEGRKTVTRRVCKPQPSAHAHTTCASGNPMGAWWETGKDINRCPHGQTGDRLWVRETWYCDHFEVQKGPYLQPADMHDLDQSREDGELVYAADGLAPYEQEQPTWKPSIHMPRWASRILLEITEVRVERLQDISEDQAKAEGVRRMRDGSDTWVSREGPGDLVTPWPTAKEAFSDLWNSINGPHAWQSNPWVWVVEFKRVTP
jgi:hypothetical protein